MLAGGRNWRNKHYSISITLGHSKLRMRCIRTARFVPQRSHGGCAERTALFELLGGVDGPLYDPDAKAYFNAVVANGDGGHQVIFHQKKIMTFHHFVKRQEGKRGAGRRTPRGSKVVTQEQAGGRPISLDCGLGLARGPVQILVDSPNVSHLQVGGLLGLVPLHVDCLIGLLPKASSINGAGCLPSRLPMLGRTMPQCTLIQKGSTLIV